MCILIYKKKLKKQIRSLKTLIILILIIITVKIKYIIILALVSFHKWSIFIKKQIFLLMLILLIFDNKYY